MTRMILFSIVSVFLPSSAYAHMGHVGEVAGHSHWVGIAAVLGAAALAVLVAKAAKRKQRADDETKAEEETEEQTEGGAA
ncbi:DUF6732 family protein [Hoeflea prorocentri]|uniref:Uncharacterized protein n=1 Tax=Hoeflea prorocentri TaxID=1922333 RepID=A0A9X3UIP4_9HYPH|nr:DUF6732 family protein [Hoeflea prorocentri]MCY6381384.1 hypothetical protein [Hoeflea prorocentri]MDA5399184.1 hypothetical protein [Hoeflea prorocentri]